MTACFCCRRDAQFVWQREFVAMLCGKCFFETLAAYNAQEPRVKGTVTFEKLMVSLGAYVSCGAFSLAAKKLGVSTATISDHVSRLEALKGHVVRRDAIGRRVPILNEYGATLMNKAVEGI